MQLAKGFKDEELSTQSIRAIKKFSRQVRGDIIKMTRLAGGGAVGGALSVVEVLATIMAASDMDPLDPDNPKRDRLIVSHEHATPAYYSVLGRMDFFDLDDAVCLYKRAGSIFEGRPDRNVPGVEWCCGVPGQGLSAACGLSLAARWTGVKPNIFVVMSDEEQQCGQIAEARRFAKKYRLNNITAVIDANNVQSVGRTSEVMPQNLKYEYIADGWDVIEINGHDPAEIYQAVRRATQIQSTPVLVLANTVMGHGVSFMENQTEYYTRGPNKAEYEEAMKELGEPSALEEAYEYRSTFGDFDFQAEPEVQVSYEFDSGKAISYDIKERMSNVAAFGAALHDMGALSKVSDQPMVVFDCGHGQSLELNAFTSRFHDKFIQAGLGNHAAVAIAAAMSADGIAVFLADYSVHAVAEVFNQLKMADINRSNLKIVATRIGLDAGEDGKSMHSTDYMGLVANLHGFRLIIPADPNQTDRVLRYMMGKPGNFIMGITGTETPVITDSAHKPLFGGDYKFEYGKVDLVRKGDGGLILTSGHMLSRAIEAWSILNKEGNAPTLMSVSCPLSLDENESPEFLKALRSGRVITYEDHNHKTGLGAQVARVIAKRGVSCRLLALGVDRYSLSGSPEDLYGYMGLDVESFTEQARKFLKR